MADADSIYAAIVKTASLDLEPPAGFASPLPITRTEANFGGIVCSTCDGSGCPDCTDPA